MLLSLPVLARLSSKKLELKRRIAAIERRAEFPALATDE